MGFNLEVPLELCEYGITSATTARDSTYQRIKMDPSNYDGATYYFEFVATNSNTSTAYNVVLRYGTTDLVTVSVPSLQVIPTVVVPFKILSSLKIFSSLILIHL